MDSGLSSKNKYIVAGIGTEIGKTIISAILVEALEADYWKPVQSGDLHLTDTDKVRALISNTVSIFHQEVYRLQEPMSPHAAAELEGLEINPEKIQVPQTDRPLIVELAGGLMVPLNRQFLNIDLIAQLGLPVILVSRYYLGSINHTLLSIELLKQRKISIAGIIFNGVENPSSKSVILEYSGLRLLGEIAEEAEITREVVKGYGKKMRPNL
ncbi:MAG: dethiobiotin synthase [Microscillaceae bacterium]|nr:dethiobiotin synthase [Microscillaceae bacterium]